jgi:hypothetical protein
MQDEARHVAFGLLALQDAYTDLTAAECEEREEFVVEASYLLKDRFLSEEVWEAMGFDVTECVSYVDNHQMMGEFRKALFSRVVPNVRRIGLWGPRVRKAFADMGVMQFADLEPDETFAADESIAEEFDRLLAQGRHRHSTGTYACDAEQVAETIAAGAEAAPPA